MAYSKDFRKKVNEYLDAGHTQREARETYGICMATINRWRKKYKAGDLSDKPVVRSFRKLDPEKLNAYVSEHPDAYLQEIGDAFGCSDTAVLKAFRRLGITRKKRRYATANKNPNK
jgi:transposase